MGFIHIRLSVSSNRHCNIDSHCELLLWSHIGFLGRTSLQSKQQPQDSSWIQAYCKAAYLPVCTLTLQHQKITSFTFRVCFASPFEEWEVTSLQYFCLLSNPFITPLFHLLLFSTVTKSDLASRERRKKKECKNRKERKIKNEDEMLLGKEVQTNQADYLFNWDTESPGNYV